MSTGVDFSVNTRLGAGTVLRGGFSTGRERITRCFAVDSSQAGLRAPGRILRPPGQRRISATAPPYQTQAKMMASFTLPGDILLAATIQNTPGPEITATYQCARAKRRWADSSPEAMPTPRRMWRLWHRGRVRASRDPGGPAHVQDVRAGAARLQANFDLFNLLNSNAVLQQQNVYGRDGATWQRPNLVLLARLAKVGFNLSF